MLYPADPPTVEEIVCVMRHASEDPHGWRLRAMIVMLWRGGLRVQETLTLSERDLDPHRSDSSEVVPFAVEVRGGGRGVMVTR
jgi:site-specific recombinase XerD